MSWLKTDYHFDEGRCIFYITHKEMLMNEGLYGAIRAASMSKAEQDNWPETIEGHIRSLIRQLRPELADASIFYMHFDVNRNRWLFGVSHPSLPRTPMAECAKEIPLDPAMTEREELADI